MSVSTFVNQVYDDGYYLPILLREGLVGSNHFKDAVQEQLSFFENELTEDLVDIATRLNLTP